jgi:conjugal transfer/entry exclusion protein
VNSHRQKKADEAAQEEARYKRFLGTAVDYTTKSFEDFVSDPLAVIRHLN